MPFNKLATKLIAVIHHSDDALSIENARMADEAGFDGVCLIHMDGFDELIDRPAMQIKRDFPRLKVIANRLTTPPDLIVERDLALGLDGSWVDNPGVSSNGYSAVAERYRLAYQYARSVNMNYLFFGSVAFKTQRPEPSDEHAADAATKAAVLGWIATTSGPATGIAPDLQKLRTMRHRIPNSDFAVASGVTPENAADISLLVDWILVSTGISKDFHTFDLEKMKKLKAATLLPEKLSVRNGGTRWDHDR
jgi:Predicted TIM-barrel enzyme